MKQSKKLLSIFLAMLMLLGTVSVVGNAALAKDQVAYDSIDNAKLTPEQVAGIVLDMLDNDLLAGMDTVDLSIIGQLRLNKVDYIIADICELRGGAIWPLGAGLLGDLYDIDFTPLRKSGKWGATANHTPWQRSDGDLQILYQLLQFLNNNAGILSNVAYGIGTSDGVDLGIVDSFLSLGEIGDILADLPGFLTRTVFDMLIYGSYGYDKDAEELGNKLPSEVDTLDKIVNVAIKNLLTKPQKYDWVPTGSVDSEGNPISEKKWDEESFILNASKLEGKNLDLSQNSFFTLLDTVLPVAYETFGTVVLNHDVKKIFMEAMGADFVRVTDAKEIATIKADSDYVDIEKEGVDASSVKNYFCNAQMWKVGNDWYFRDYVTTQIGTDAATGEPITEKQHRYFKAETYNVDELFEVFNWDYYLTADSLDFATMLKPTSEGGYGSLAGSLNHIIHVILKNAISSEFLAEKGTSIEALWADGGNDKFNENLMNTAKFLLINYTFMFFGRNEAYVDLNTLEAKPEFVQKVNSFKNDDNGREGLIAYMLLPMLGDVLPQLVYSADMFEDGLQIEQVAALLVREFVTDLTPQVNDYVCDYDALIFADASLKTGRTLVKGKDSAYWMNIVLNMGLDLAAIYLDNIANFGVDLTSLKTLHSYAGNGVEPWQIVLEEIIDWAVLYIGDGANSVIKGLDPTTLEVTRSVTYTASNDSHTVANNYDGKAFWRVSTALNTLLPLGIVNGCSSDSFGLDVEVLFNKLKNDIIPSLNIEGIIGLFGRNDHETNFLGQTNLYKEILDLVNQLLSAILGNNLLVVGTNASTILANAVSQASLKTTINNLFTGLYGRREGLLRGILPVLAAFISDWGGEQSLASPDLGIAETTKADGGNLNVTLTLRNGSKGIWRSYMQNGTRVQDEQYTYDVKSISSLQGLGLSGGTGALAYGTTVDVTLSKSGVPAAGIADRIDVTYTVSDENGNLMANGAQFTKSYFTYVSYDNDLIMNERHGSSWGNDMNADMPRYLYYAEEDLPNISSDTCFSYYNEGGSSKTGKITSSSGTQNGITLNNISVSAKEGSSSAAPFTFDPSAYTSVGEAGAAYTYTYKMDNGNKDDSYSTTLFVYSGADYGLLEGLVEDEVSKNRVLADYNDDGSKYNAYLGALANGMAIIYNPRVDGNFWTDCKARYTTLKTAVEALEAVEKTAEEKAQAGGSIDGLVDNLKTQLDGIEKGFDGKDYRTYMLYRWDRYKDARSDARWIIDLKEEVKFGAPTKHFPYGSYSQAQYTNIVGNDKYKDFLLALLVDMTEEEKAAAAENYKNRSNEYYSVTTLDVTQYSNLLTRMSQRLITRTTNPVTSYLQKEIDSAKKDIGTAKGNYSDKSWAPYEDALSNAEAALSSGSQDAIFAAKYALQVARNNLRTATQEADYAELNTLIAQAEGALAARSSYKNENVDFGKILMALGYTTESGTKLFGGAKDVVNYSYDKHDQDEVDDAADELKAVLAELEFKDFGTKKPASVVSTDVDTGAKDENDQPIKENMYTAKIGAEQVKDQVAKALAVTGCTVEVSLDEKYAASSDTNLEKVPVGTGATVTILQNVGGVDVPVATIKLIVEGDVTGDGVIDALDCMIAELTKNGDTELTGLYYIAGNLANDTVFDINDVNAIVDKAVPDKIA